MDKKVLFAASMLLLLVCATIAGSQRSAVFAEGVTPIVTPTKDGGTGVVIHAEGTVIGVKRRSHEVVIRLMANGLELQFNPSTSNSLPPAQFSLNFAKIEFTYVNQSGDPKHVVAKPARLKPKPTPTPSDVPIG